MKTAKIGEPLTFINTANGEILSATVIDIVDGNVPTPVVDHPDYGLVQLKWTKKGWTADGLE